MPRKRFRDYQSLLKGSLKSPVDMSRGEILAALKKNPNCDLLIIGGGIQGATVARLAAFNGLRVLLLEKGDFGWHSRGFCGCLLPALLSGLEKGQWLKAVCELRRQVDLCRSAFHIAAPQGVALHLPQTWLGIKSWGLRAALRLGSGSAEFCRRGSRQLPATEQDNLGTASAAYDVFFSPQRLVLDTVVAARQEGAQCLNHSEVVSFMLRPGGGVSVGWRDQLSGESHEITAGMLLNCAGPWIHRVGRIKDAPLPAGLAVMRMTNLVIKGSGQPLKLYYGGEKSRGLLVGPYGSGTLAASWAPVSGAALGTDDLTPEDRQRAQSLLSAVGLADLVAPEQIVAGWSSTFLWPDSRHAAPWSCQNGVLTLNFGTFSSAAATAHQGLRRVYKLAGISNRCQPLRSRLLPGAGLYEAGVQDFCEAGRAQGISEQVLAEVMGRLGSRVRFIPALPEAWDLLPGDLLKGELQLACRGEMAESSEDLIRRFDLNPGHPKWELRCRALPDFFKNSKS